MLVASLIFVVTYVVVALGRAPGLRLDRTGAALLGASLMVASGTLTLDEAYRAIDIDTLTLLLGMMIVVANLRIAGFFQLAAAWVAANAGRPVLLLLAVVLISGLLSAFLVNDTVCLMLTPLVAEATLAMRRQPEPYLLALAMASNIGSVATITGNPQNIMIGSFSHLPYVDFAAALSPVAACGLVIVTLLILIAYRAEFFSSDRLRQAPIRLRWNRWLLLKSCCVTLGTVAFFFAGQPPAKVAILAGALLLLTRRVKPERVYREIDWSLLLFFAGLFIVVHGLEKAVLSPDLLAAAGRLQLGHAGRARRGIGPALQSGEQRAGRAGIEALRPGAAGSKQGLAGPGHGLDLGRQLHHPRLGRQSDRSRASPPARYRHRLLALFQAWRAGDAAYHRARCVASWITPLQAMA